MPKLTVSIPIITTYKKYNNYRKLGFAKANSYANYTQDQIDVAYRRRLKRVQDPMIIQELNNAYHILSDPKLRQEYDKEMKEAEMREEQESRSFPSKKRFRTKSYDQRLGLPQRSKKHYSITNRCCI